MYTRLNACLRLGVEMSANIKLEEMRATLLSFLMVFTLMAAYFILRPVRDAMASDWNDTEVSFLWNLQFFISVAMVSFYGLLVARVRFSAIVPIVYSVFAVSFASFYFVTPIFIDGKIIEKIFYVWVSAFSLFHLSVFWSLMSTIFTKQQGERLFPVIASGASLGAIVGPSIPAVFATHLGLQALMLIAACGLFAVVPMVVYLSRLKRVDLGGASSEIECGKSPLGGAWWSGFKDVITNRYLLRIALFILLYVFISSFIYFEQKNLLAEFSRPDRAQILGSIDWIVNTLTFVLAFFVTGRLVTNLGMTTALLLLPLLLIAGMLVLAAAPLVIVLLALQVSRRAGNYAITKPAREMLFSQVTQDQRFKSKPVVDIVVYRGGDAVSGSLFALLSDGLGLGLAAIALIGAGISSLWAGLALKLGQQYDKSSVDTQHQPDPGSSTTIVASGDFTCFQHKPQNLK